MRRRVNLAPARALLLAMGALLIAGAAMLRETFAVFQHYWLLGCEYTLLAGGVAGQLWTAAFADHLRQWVAYRRALRNQREAFGLIGEVRPHGPLGTDIRRQARERARLTHPTWDKIVPVRKEPS